MWKNTRRAFAPQRDWLIILGLIAILIAILFPFVMRKKDRPVPYSQLAPLDVIVDSDTDSFLIVSGDIVKVDGKLELITIFKKEKGEDGWQNFLVSVQYVSSGEVTSLPVMPIADFRNQMNGKHFTHIKKGTPEHTELMRLFEKK